MACRLTFTGSSTTIKKIESLMLQATASQPKRKIKLEKSDDGSESKTDKCDAHVWITYLNNTLSFADKRVITKGERLTDKHINFCQAVLKAHFPIVEGLGCTLYQSNRCDQIKSGLPRSSCEK